MTCGVIVINVGIPLSRSLKNKRSQIKPLLNRLHREFNVSCAELDKLELWNEAVIGCAMLANDRRFLDAALAKIPPFIQKHFPETEIHNFSIQFL